MESLSVHSASEFTLAELLPLLLQRVPPAMRLESMARAKSMFDGGELPLRDVLIACLNGQPVGAMLGTLAPGAVGSIWPPQVRPGRFREAAEDALIQAVIHRLREQGVTMCQAVLPAVEFPNAAALARHGFQHVMQLLFLRHRLEPDLHSFALEGTLEFLPYSQVTETVFGATLLRTYEGSLDCPELNDRRTLAEIMAGHVGDYAENRWWLVQHAAEPVGVLLLSLLTETTSWEVSYMGLVPEARRQGFGRQLMQHALAEARSARAASLLLSVDARNHPAIQLYLQLGFEPYDEREVYLLLLEPAAESA